MPVAAHHRFARTSTSPISPAGSRPVVGIGDGDLDDGGADRREPLVSRVPVSAWRALPRR